MLTIVEHLFFRLLVVREAWAPIPLSVRGAGIETRRSQRELSEGERIAEKASFLNIS